MAKVRVYELARELNLDSKELVEKLLAGGINIKNYMSTLDEDATERAREIVSGEVMEIIEEKRIKSTVIRRRKKVKVKQDIRELKLAEEEEKEKKKPAVLRPEKPSEKAELPEAVTEIPTALKDAEKESKVKMAAKGKTAPKIELKEEEKPPAPDKSPGAVIPIGKAEESVSPEKVVEPVPKAKARPKKAKRKKVDQPAKIIRLPEEGPLGGILAKKAKKKSVDIVPEVQEIPPKPKDMAEEFPKKDEGIKPKRKKKGKKRKDKEIELEEASARVPLRHRKKEVYERADLYDGRPRKHIGKKGAKAKEDVKKLKQTEITVPKAIKRRIKVQEFVSVAELSKVMGIKSTDLIKRLMSLGYRASVNEDIDFDTASVVADDFGYELELDVFEEAGFFEETEDRIEDLEVRPPVVTIMGHVDHGKTSLLDFIRKSNIIGGEYGGITQHIGAYYVEAEGGDIVFLDTPGHEAFTAMRARGAKVTDIIVLVVAADDGVMPQTKEAINHAKAAGIPIVVAVNKIDKPEANPEKVNRELAELGLTPEDWGGDTIFGNISAKTGEGIDDLLSLILLQAEILELKGNPNKAARGTIIEAALDRSKGPVATVLIKNGTLHQGDYFVCGEHYGRVRAMLDQRGKQMKSAGPSVPVELYGISGVPMAGDEFIAVQDEKRAKQVIEHRKSESKKFETVKRGLVSLDDLFERIKQGDVKELNIVLKTDVQGSLEALSESLDKQSTAEVKLKIIHSATGAISESDVMLASASGAIVIGFNVRANPRVREIAERENVDIRYYDVIYNVVKDIRLAMVGLLEPVYEERIIGRADIKEIFRVPKIGAVAGCQVTDGHVERNANVRLLRDDVVVFDGKIASLRRFKEDAKEVQSGYECGIGLENFQDIKPGDIFEVYQLEEVQAEL
jgi:translation initiation factor IF-2